MMLKDITDAIPMIIPTIEYMFNVCPKISHAVTDAVTIDKVDACNTVGTVMYFKA